MQVCVATRVVLTIGLAGVSNPNMVMLTAISTVTRRRGWVMVRT